MPPKSKRYESLAMQLKEEGNEAFLNSKYDRAIQLYTKALQLEENPIFYNNRSQAYFYSEQNELALMDCNRALQLNPRYVKAILNKADMLIELGRVEEARYFLHSIPEPSNEVLNILRRIQEPLRPLRPLYQDESEQQRQRTLIDWLKSGAAYFPKLRIESYDKDYRGVHAAKTISAKELILFVPRSHMITLEMAKNTPVARKLLQYRVDLLSPKHSYLSTFLLQERCNPDSFWRPYLDVLPKNYTNFPIFYSPEDLDWLTGSPFQKQVREKLQDISKDYHDICQVAPEFSKHSFEDFCWARMTASSRIFGINIKGVKTDAFVPLADMLNHRRPKLTSWMYSDERSGFIIETDEKIERDEMIYDSYGRKCNSRFLLNYGFIVEGNDANEVQVSVPLAGHDHLQQIKEELMKDCLQIVKHFRIMIETEESNVMEFMGYCRFLSIRSETLLKEFYNTYDVGLALKPQKTPPLRIENETEMWKMISSICQHQLQQYPTTLEQDHVIQQTYELTQNQKNCLLLRIGEKEILTFYIVMAEKMTRLLRSTKQEIQKYTANSQNFKHLHYINRCLLTLVTSSQS